MGVFDIARQLGAARLGQTRSWLYPSAMKGPGDANQDDKGTSQKGGY